MSTFCQPLGQDSLVNRIFSSFYCINACLALENRDSPSQALLVNQFIVIDKRIMSHLSGSYFNCLG